MYVRFRPQSLQIRIIARVISKQSSTSDSGHWIQNTPFQKRVASDCKRYPMSKAQFNKQSAITCKLCEIGRKFVVITHSTRQQPDFRLVSKSVTSNDLERRNGNNFALFWRIGQFWGQYVKVVEDRPILLPNRKSHTGFRLVQKSLTLNDLEPTNDRGPWLSLRHRRCVFCLF